MTENERLLNKYIKLLEQKLSANIVEMTRLQFMLEEAHIREAALNEQLTQTREPVTAEGEPEEKGLGYAGTSSYEDGPEPV